MDGFSESPLVLCEAWAHVGSPKSAQKHKVMKDAFKVLFASARLEKDGRRILLFGDQDAAAYFRGPSWMAQCLREYGSEVEVIDLPPDLRGKVTKAQKRHIDRPTATTPLWTMGTKCQAAAKTRREMSTGCPRGTVAGVSEQDEVSSRRTVHFVEHLAGRIYPRGFDKAQAGERTYAQPSRFGFSGTVTEEML